jgi:solute carrier family 35 protein C2
MAQPHNGSDDLDSTAYITRTSLSDDGEAGLDELEDLHLASISEKKRLWWKNATINAAFISSW